MPLILGLGCAMLGRQPVSEVIAAWKEGETVTFEGEFLDEPGHTGPLKCELTRVNAVIWIMTLEPLHAPDVGG